MTDMERYSSIEGAIVVECDRHLTSEQFGWLKQELELTFPGKRCLVLANGLKLHLAQHEAISRVEAKLDSLLEMLAQDAQDEPQAFDLSGQPIPRERGENEPL